MLCSFFRKLEKAGTVDFKRHPARKVGTRSRQCRPKVPVPEILEFVVAFRDSGRIFPAIFPGLCPQFSSRTPEHTPETATGNSHSLLEFSDFLSANDVGDFFGILQRSPRIVSGQNAQSMRVKRSGFRLFFGSFSTFFFSTSLTPKAEWLREPFFGPSSPKSKSPVAGEEDRKHWV